MLKHFEDETLGGGALEVARSKHLNKHSILKCLDSSKLSISENIFLLNLISGKQFFQEMAKGYPADLILSFV